MTLAFVAVASLLLLASPTQAAQPANQAVVLVSGINSPQPFSTPVPGCAGQEGSIFGPFVAPSLKQQGFNVYTVPENKGSQTFPPCGGTPPASAYIDVTEGIDVNGQALANFLAYLNQTFGITEVQLVTHSFGAIWSRSAITQSGAYTANVKIDSLITLGGPHTGSFVADIAMDVVGAQCSSIRNPVERLACKFFQTLVNDAVQYYGAEAISETTAAFIGDWNPDQQIQSCPVTPIAGTFFDLGPLDPLLNSYYVPNDGLVGLGSAAANNAPGAYEPPSIPGLQPVSKFDVIHGHESYFSWFAPNNLLNQADIVARIAQALNQAPTQSCNVQPAPPPPPPPTPPSPQVVTPTDITSVSGGGTLPKPRRGDVVLVSSRSKVRCGKRLVKGRPFIRSRKYEVIVGPRCPKRLRVSGGRVIHLRPVKGKKVSVTAEGNEVQIKVSGRGQRERVTAEVLIGKKWKRLPLSKNGKGKLPSGDNSVPVRVTIIGPGGSRTVAVVIVRTNG